METSADSRLFPSLRNIDDNKILTPNQKSFLHEFTKSELRNVFRLTGGTALSAFYLEHRLSEDLDFFSEEKIKALFEKLIKDIITTEIA